MVARRDCNTISLVRADDVMLRVDAVTVHEVIAKRFEQRIGDADKKICAEDVAKIFMSIASAMNCQTLEQATSILPDLLSKWNLNFSAKVTDKELCELSSSVHIPRLKNNPVALREKNLHELYEKILSGKFLKG